MRRQAWALSALLLVGCGQPGAEPPAPGEPVGAVAQRSEGWDAVWTMAQGRVGHTLTLLPDGRVLIAGGRTPDGVSGQTELFDPFSGRLASGPPLLVPRYFHTATTLTDGRVLVAGGSDGQTPLATSEVFDLRAGSFAPGPALTGPRQQQVAVATASGELWLLGGQGDSGPLASSERFLGSAFVPGPAMAAARFDHAAVALEQGDLLVFGGHDGAKALASIERLAAGAQAFEPAGEMKSPRAGHTATLRNGTVVVAGGSDGATLLDTLEEYSAVAASSQLTGKGLARARHTATLLADGALLLSGGASSDERFTGEAIKLPQRGAAGQGAVLLPTGDLLLAGGEIDGQPSAELRLLASPGDQLTEEAGPDLKALREGHEAVLLPDGRVLLVGGIETGKHGGQDPMPDAVLKGFVGTLEIVDPVAGTVTAAAALKQPRWRPAALLLPDGRVLISGGSFAEPDDFSPIDKLPVYPLSSTEIYDPATGQVSEGPKMFAARTLHRMTPLPDGRIFVSGGSTFWFDELLDLTTGTTTPVPSPGARFSHSATTLADGRVLLAGGASGALPQLSLYDPDAGPSGDYGLAAQAKVAGETANNNDFLAAALPDGRVLLSAVVTQATSGANSPATMLLFSPNAGPGSVAEGPTIEQRWSSTATLLPTGKVLLLGGCSQPGCQGGTLPTPPPVALFSPTEGGTGSLRTFPPPSSPRARHTATLLPDGRVLIAGGYKPDGEAGSLASTRLLSLGPATSLPRPRFAPLPSPVTPGHALPLDGQDLLRLSPSGGTRLSASDLPVPVWLSSQGIPLLGRSLAWQPTAVSWDAPASLFRGPGWLFPLSGGQSGVASFASLAAATLGARCAQGKLCPSGYCVDGVCCDSACSGNCQACSALQKGQGEDGVCGPAAAGQDPHNDCEATSAQSCGGTGVCDGKGGCLLHPSDTECAPAVCSDGAFSPARHCSGGACAPASNSDCGFFRCASPTQCATSCDSDAGCKSGASCRGGQCVIGCVGRPEGEVCRAARCDRTTGLYFKESRCDGQGQCADETELCAPFNCVGDGPTARCATGCADDSECAPDAACEQGSCADQTILRCDGEHTLVARGKPPQDCAPLRCEAGACLVRCRSQADCVEGFACKEDGSCGPPPDLQQPARSGCAQGPRPAGSGWGLALALGALARWRVRARAPRPGRA